VEALVHHLAADFVQYLSGIFAEFGKRMVGRSVASLLERKLHRAIRQGREEGVDLVNQTMAEAPASFGIEVEAHKYAILD